MTRWQRPPAHSANTPGGRSRRYGLVIVSSGLIALAIMGFAASTLLGSTPVTRTITISPVTGADRLSPGYRVTQTFHSGTCEAGSDVLSGVYRCFAGNYVLDPCWADRSGAPKQLVDCVLEPWTHSVTRIELTQPLAASPGGRRSIWGLALTGGQRCLALQGAHSGFDGGRYIVNFACTNSLGLVNEPNRSRPSWTIREARVHGASDVLGPTAVIATAWYGSPSHL
jgi:hypothetical protein